MLRTTAIAFITAAVLGSTAVSAQTIDLGGRGGPSVDLRSDRQRERDFQREHVRRDREYGSRDGEYGRRGGADRRDLSTGSVGRNGCRTVTIQEQDDYGRTVTRRRSDC